LLAASISAADEPDSDVFRRPIILPGDRRAQIRIVVSVRRIPAAAGMWTYSTRAVSGQVHIPAPNRTQLLDFDLGASAFQLGLDLGGVVLADAFLDRLRRTLDQVLGFLEAKAGDGAHFLDHVDLVRTGIGEDHVELGLFLSGSSATGSSAANSGNGDRRSGRNAPLLFEKLGELGGLEDGKGRQLVDDLLQI